MSAVAVKIKEKKLGQRACNEKRQKGNYCLGHLKRWYTPDKETLGQVGKDGEVYRCERCRTLYCPTPGDRSTAGQKYELRPVNLLGVTARRNHE